MKIKLLVATVDTSYAKLISDNISERFADIIDISVCCALECFCEVLKKQKFDVALIDATLIKGADTVSIHLPLLLCSENESADDDIPVDLKKINKHQRISTIVAAILEKYALVSRQKFDTDFKNANITAFWSPAGGVGKTSVALAYALSNASADGISRDNTSPGKDVFYLNLENFSSVPGFFDKAGKSISSVFEMLDTREGNIKMLIQGISCRDKGIMYMCGPDNYDDMNILTDENILELITACSKLVDELIVDLPCTCDTRTGKVFEMADKVFVVAGESTTSEVKLMQFTSQNDLFDRIKEKIVLVANRGAVITNPPVDHGISLPLIESNDMVSVVRELSRNFTV